MISEVILDEVLKHHAKVGLTKAEISKKLVQSKINVAKAPELKKVQKYGDIITDPAMPMYWPVLMNSQLIIWSV